MFSDQKAGGGIRKENSRSMKQSALLASGGWSEREKECDNSEHDPQYVPRGYKPEGRNAAGSSSLILQEESKKYITGNKYERMEPQEINPYLRDQMLRVLSGEILMTKQEGQSAILVPLSFKEYLKSKLMFFMSSTCCDTRFEQDVAIECCESIRQFCAEYGHEFQMVSMRWGINEDMICRHGVIDFCLKFVKKCMDESIGPAIVSLLSHRFGSVTLPSEIRAFEFHRIKKAANNSKFLGPDYWVFDESCSPEIYRLKPIYDHPSYKTGTNKWDDYSSIVNVIQEALKMRIPSCLTPDIYEDLKAKSKVKYFWDEYCAHLQKPEGERLKSVNDDITKAVFDAMRRSPSASVKPNISLYDPDNWIQHKNSPPNYSLKRDVRDRYWAAYYLALEEYLNLRPDFRFRPELCAEEFEFRNRENPSLFDGKNWLMKSGKYILQPRGEIDSTLYDDIIGELQWQYKSSVTLFESRRGIISNPKRDKQSICFIRNISDIETVSEEILTKLESKRRNDHGASIALDPADVLSYYKTICDYYQAEHQFNYSDFKQKLRTIAKDDLVKFQRDFTCRELPRKISLKWDYRESCAPDSSSISNPDVLKYKSILDHEGGSVMNKKPPDSWNNYLKQFQEEFTGTIKSKIQQHYEKPIQNPEFREPLLHYETLLRSKSIKGFSRKKVLDSIKDYIDNESCCTLHVSNLPTEAVDDIAQFFSDSGFSLSSITRCTSERSGKKYYCDVTFNTHGDARDALEALNGKPIFSRGVKSKCNISWKYDKSKLLLIKGESGCGKSWLLSNAIEVIKQNIKAKAGHDNENERDGIVIYRFIGTTMQSSDVFNLIKSILRQLKKVASVDLTRIKKASEKKKERQKRNEEDLKGRVNEESDGDLESSSRDSSSDHQSDSSYFEGSNYDDDSYDEETEEELSEDFSDDVKEEEEQEEEENEEDDEDETANDPAYAKWQKNKEEEAKIEALMKEYMTENPEFYDWKKAREVFMDLSLFCDTLLLTEKVVIVLDSLDQLPEHELNTCAKWLPGLFKDLPDNVRVIASIRSSRLNNMELLGAQLVRPTSDPTTPKPPGDVEYPNAGEECHLYELGKNIIDLEKNLDDIDISEPLSNAWCSRPSQGELVPYLRKYCFEDLLKELWESQLSGSNSSVGSSASGGGSDTNVGTQFVSKTPLFMTLIIDQVMKIKVKNRIFEEKDPVDFMDQVSLKWTSGHIAKVNVNLDPSNISPPTFDVESSDSKIPLRFKVPIDSIRRKGEVKCAHNSILDADEVEELREAAKMGVKGLIGLILDKLEEIHTPELVCRCLGLMTLCCDGVSETELESLLSLMMSEDEAFTKATLAWWSTPDNRFPPMVVQRIFFDLDRYVIERMSGGVSVKTWFHKEFAEVVESRYMDISPSYPSSSPSPVLTPVIEGLTCSCCKEIKPKNRFRFKRLKCKDCDYFIDIKFRVNDNVIVHSTSVPQTWDPAVIISANSDGSFNVKYANNQILPGIHIQRIRASQPESNRNKFRIIADKFFMPQLETGVSLAGQDIRFAPSDNVRVLNTKVNRWFHGQIISVNGDDTYNINYNNSESEQKVPKTRVEILTTKTLRAKGTRELEYVFDRVSVIVLEKGMEIGAVKRKKRKETLQFGDIITDHKNGFYDVKFSSNHYVELVSEENMFWVESSETMKIKSYFSFGRRIFQENVESLVTNYKNLPKLQELTITATRFIRLAQKFKFMTEDSITEPLSVVEFEKFVTWMADDRKTLQNVPRSLPRLAKSRPIFGDGNNNADKAYIRLKPNATSEYQLYSYPTANNVENYVLDPVRNCSWSLQSDLYASCTEDEIKIFSKDDGALSAFQLEWQRNDHLKHKCYRCEVSKPNCNYFRCFLCDRHYYCQDCSNNTDFRDEKKCKVKYCPKHKEKLPLIKSSGDIVSICWSRDPKYPSTLVGLNGFNFADNENKKNLCPIFIIKLNEHRKQIKYRANLLDTLFYSELKGEQDTYLSVEWVHVPSNDEKDRNFIVITSLAYVRTFKVTLNEPEYSKRSNVSAYSFELSTSTSNNVKLPTINVKAIDKLRIFKGLKSCMKYNIDNSNFNQQRFEIGSMFDFGWKSVEVEDRNGILVTPGNTGLQIEDLKSEDLYFLVSWSFDDKRFGIGYDKVVDIWSLEDLQIKKICRIFGHDLPILSFSWCLDVDVAKKYILATCSEDQTISTWDTNTGDCLCVITGHRGHVSSLAWDPSGRYILSTGSTDCGKTNVWNIDAALKSFKTLNEELDKGKQYNIMRGSKSFISSMAVHYNSDPKKSLIAVSSEDEWIYVYSMHPDDQGIHSEIRLRCARGKIGQIAWSPNGTYLAVSNQILVRIWKMTPIVFEERQNGEIMRDWQYTDLKGDDTELYYSPLIANIDWSNDGKRLVASCGNGMIFIWDIDKMNAGCPAKEYFKQYGISFKDNFCKTIDDAPCVSWNPADSTCFVVSDKKEFISRNNSGAKSVAAYTLYRYRYNKKAQMWTKTKGSIAVDLKQVFFLKFSPCGTYLAFGASKCNCRKMHSLQKKCSTLQFVLFIVKVEKDASEDEQAFESEFKKVCEYPVVTLDWALTETPGVFRLVFGDNFGNIRITRLDVRKDSFEHTYVDDSIRLYNRPIVGIKWQKESNKNGQTMYTGKLIVAYQFGALFVFDPKLDTKMCQVPWIDDSKKMKPSSIRDSQLVYNIHCSGLLSQLCHLTLTAVIPGEDSPNGIGSVIAMKSSSNNPLRDYLGKFVLDDMLSAKWYKQSNDIDRSQRLFADGTKYLGYSEKLVFESLRARVKIQFGYYYEYVDKNIEILEVYRWPLLRQKSFDEIKDKGIDFLLDDKNRMVRDLSKLNYMLVIICGNLCILSHRQDTGLLNISTLKSKVYCKVEKRDHIRPSNKPRSAGDNRKFYEGGEVEVGHVVEALYRGRDGHYYEGEITAVPGKNGSKKYEIAYHNDYLIPSEDRDENIVILEFIGDQINDIFAIKQQLRHFQIEERGGTDEIDVFKHSKDLLNCIANPHLRVETPVLSRLKDQKDGQLRDLNKLQGEILSGLKYNVEAIQGPPGTGKSRLLPHIVEACATDKVFVVTAFQNDAIDAIVTHFASFYLNNCTEATFFVVGADDSLSSEAKLWTLRNQALNLDHIKDLRLFVDGIRRIIMDQSCEKDHLIAISKVVQVEEKPPHYFKGNQQFLDFHGHKCKRVVIDAKRCIEANYAEGIDLTEKNRNINWICSYRTKLREYFRFAKQTYLNILNSEMLKIAKNAKAIICTTSSISSRLFEEQSSRVAVMRISSIIIDEAGNFSDMKVAGLMKILTLKNIICVGDQMQLPPSSTEALEVFSCGQYYDNSCKLGEDCHREHWKFDVDGKPIFERTKFAPNSTRGGLLERLALVLNHTNPFGMPIGKNRVPFKAVRMLEEQYRMPNEVRRFISERFYEGKLRQGGERFLKEPHGMYFIDYTATTNKNVGRTDNLSYVNRIELSIIRRVLSSLIESGSAFSKTIMIITFYQGQEIEITKIVNDMIADLGNQNQFLKPFKKIEVMTVDKALGREHDIIIVSCVRNDRRGNKSFYTFSRLNVSMSRCKYMMIIVGNYAVLREYKSLNEKDLPFNGSFSTFEFLNKCIDKEAWLLFSDEKRISGRTASKFLLKDEQSQNRIFSCAPSNQKKAEFLEQLGVEWEESIAECVRMGESKGASNSLSEWWKGKLMSSNSPLKASSSSAGGGFSSNDVDDDDDDDGIDYRESSYIGTGRLRKEYNNIVGFDINHTLNDSRAFQDFDENIARKGKKAERAALILESRFDIALLKQFFRSDCDVSAAMSNRLAEALVVDLKLHSIKRLRDARGEKLDAAYNACQVDPEDRVRIDSQLFPILSKIPAVETTNKSQSQSNISPNITQIDWNDVILPQSITAGALLMGKGAYATVYRATLKAKGRLYEVAVKIFNQTLQEDYEKLLHDAVEEAETIIGLTSRMISKSSIVNLYGLAAGQLSKDLADRFGLREDSHRVGLVTEVLEGGSLHTLLYPPSDASVPKRILSLEFKLEMLHGICDGLQEIHGAEGVHGDLSSKNVMLKDNKNPYVCLIDFGLSAIKAANQDTILSLTNATKGTQIYCAPEMLDGTKFNGKFAKSDWKTDIYAFGVLCWELLRGMRPYYDRADSTIVHHVVNGGRPDPAEISQNFSDTPPELINMFEKCWSADRNVRPTAVQCHSIISQILAVVRKQTFDIFFSHAWVKKPVLSNLHRWLTLLGYRVWYDQINMGFNFPSSMRIGIDQSSVVVVCACSKYERSNACMFELRCAADKNKPAVTKPIVAILLENWEGRWPPQIKKKYEGGDLKGLANITHGSTLFTVEYTDIKQVISVRDILQFPEVQENKEEEFTVLAVVDVAGAKTVTLEKAISLKSESRKSKSVVAEARTPLKIVASEAWKQGQEIKELLQLKDQKYLDIVDEADDPVWDERSLIPPSSEQIEKLRIKFELFTNILENAGCSKSIAPTLSNISSISSSSAGGGGIDCSENQIGGGIGSGLQGGVAKGHTEAQQCGESTGAI